MELLYKTFRMLRRVEIYWRPLPIPSPGNLIMVLQYESKPCYYALAGKAFNEVDIDQGGFHAASPLAFVFNLKTKFYYAGSYIYWIINAAIKALKNGTTVVTCLPEIHLYATLPSIFHLTTDSAQRELLREFWEWSSEFKYLAELARENPLE